MIKVFKSTGESFSAFYAAEKFVRELGYSVGSMQRGMPIGLYKGDADISKWSNMTRAERESLHGTLESTSFRDMDVVVNLKD
jgi:hypothetical protein